MDGSNQTVSPRPLKVKASVTSLQTIEYLLEARPGWSVLRRAIQLARLGVGCAIRKGPEIEGAIRMTSEVAALYAKVEGTRFVTRISL